MKEEERCMLSKWMEMAQTLAPPDGVVYIRASPSTCHSRIATRGRHEEQNLTHAALEVIHDKHEAYIQQLKDAGVRVLVIDGDLDKKFESSHVEAIQTFMSWVPDENASRVSCENSSRVSDETHHD
jgi:deoxyadenosine/deoxycytidine kinase